MAEAQARPKVDMLRFFQADLLSGRLAVVTGGGTGIGLVAARALGQLGATVVIASRNQDQLSRACAELTADGIRSGWQCLDIREPTTVDRALDRVFGEYGGLDILVNNAGGQFVAPAEKISSNGWRSVIDLNLNGTFYCTQAAARHMMAGSGGTILNVVVSFVDRSSAGMVHSGAARAGVAHMTRTLAYEWAPFGITLNALGPQMLTDAARKAYGAAGIEHIQSSTPLGRWATEQEVGAWIVTLCSPIAGYTTGAMIPLDGGTSVGAGLSFRGDAFPG